MRIKRIISRLAVFALAALPISDAFAGEQSAPTRVAPYLVRDHDPHLTEIARSALPLIAALESFRAKYGRCPGLRDQPELTALLPSGVKIADVFQGGFALSRGEIPPWMYQVPAEDPLQCSLSKKLSWDPDLVFQFDGASGHWLYAPGDGGDDVPLALDP